MIPNRYTVVESISRGGMAIVFKVTDKEEGQIRALKLLPLTGCSPTAVELFRLEFARVSSLEHPHIVRVYDFGSAGDEALYFVMEYLEGLHFDEALRGRPFDTVIELSIQICDALSYIHSRGIVHGDIKPANVLVVSGEGGSGPPEKAGDAPENGGLTVKLTDFGLSRAMSQAGIAGGTHAYVAPEVIRGLPVDARADLYSFGAMLYELVAGARLFSETSEEALLRAHVLKRPISPREINPSVPTELANVILKLLEKDPERRYQSARELSRVLTHVAGLEVETEILSPQPVALLSPEIVGREEEISVLRESLASCRADGKGGFFLVTGEAGIGKTRLLDWLRLAASMDDLRVALMRSDESFASSGRVRLRWSGKAIGAEPRAHCEVPEEVESNRPVDGGSRRGLAEFSGADPLFKSIFPGTMDKLEPSVVLIDDAHLGGPELLSSLIANVPFTCAMPLLFFCSCEVEAFEKGTAAEKLYSELESHAGVRELALRRLSIEEVFQLASSMLAVEPLDEMRPLAEWLFLRSRGIPMLVEELLTELASRGCIKRVGERVTWDDLSGEASIVSVLGAPDLLERKLGALSPDESVLLKAGSISGNAFRTEALGFVLSKPPAEIARLVSSLRDKGIIEPGEPGYYVFSHPVARRTVFQGIDAGVKRELHAKMALWLEKNEPETGLAELALHLEESGRNESALACRMKCFELAVEESSYLDALQHGRAAISLARAAGQKDLLTHALGLAADSAERAGSDAEALRLWEERLSLIPGESGGERLQATLRIAKLKLKFSRYDEAEERLLEAMKLASAGGFEKDRAEILADMSWVYFRTSRDDEALKSLEEAARLASEGGMEALLARIENRSGVVLSKLGRLEESERRHREAVRLGWLSGEADVVAPCLNNLGLILLKRGRLEEAESAISEACDKAGEAGELIVLSACHNNLGLVRKELLELDGALESHLRSMELRKRCGDLVGSGRTSANVAVIYRLKGEIQLARRFYAEAYRIAEQFDLKHEGAVAAGNLAEVEGLTGSLDEAERLYLEAMEIHRENGDRDGVSTCAAGLGHAFLRNGDSLGALQWARKAIEASSIGSQEKVVAEQVLVETLCSLGEIEEAGKELERLSLHTDEETRSVGLGILRRMEGLVLEKSGNLKEAIERYRSSCSVLSQEGDSLERGRSLLSLGEALLAYRRETASGESSQSKKELLAEALSVLEEADQIFERMQVGPERARAMSALLNAYREASSLPGATAQKEETDTLFKTAELINSTLPSSVVLEKIMDLALEKTGGERGLIVLTNKESGEIEKVLSRSLEDQTEIDALEISRTVIRRVTRGGQALATPDASVDPELKDIKSVAQLEIRSILCVPLRARNKVIGAVYLDNRSVPAAFGSAHQNFMEGFANLAGMAIQNSMLREELEGMNQSLNRENLELRKQVASHYRFDQIVGESPQMKRVFGAIEKVASSGATIMITGASGTGKELVARAIHFNSPRRDKPFIPVNCASIPRELIEGELFGIEDRVATGVSKRIGVFEQANGGSIFLDEIGDMSLDLQARLLRVLQEREFTRVGGRRSIKVDVRVICATNKNLSDEMARGNFRDDLYYRISGIPINIPPLKERKGDIPHLVAFFLRKYSALHKRSIPPKISEEIMRALTEGEWEGNVRELENCIERFVVMCTPGEEVRFGLLPQELKTKALSLSSASASGTTGKGKLKEEVAQVEKQRLIEALIRNNGNRSKVGREIGISEQSVRYKIRKHHINVRQLCRGPLT